MPKINLTSILWPFAILIIALSAFYLKPWQTKPQETISVSAQGKVQTIPNIAKITASVVSKNPNIDKARSDNEQKISTIVTKLKGLGVEEKDIKTQDISTGQTYQDLSIQSYPVPPRPNTNQFSTTLEITIRNFDTTDQILIILTQNGLTNLYGPQLITSDDKLEEAKTRARESAVEDARKKAQTLARASGRKVGKAVNIKEMGDYGYPTPLMAQSGLELKQKAAQIQPGQNEVTINLQVDFSLK